MELDQPGPPNPFKLFYFIICQKSHFIPTELSQIPAVATTTASLPIGVGTFLFFIHKHTPRHSFFNTVLHDAHDVVPYITSSVYFEPETVHLQME